jgi:hypothetical protein
MYPFQLPATLWGRGPCACSDEGVGLRALRWGLFFALQCFVFVPFARVPPPVPPHPRPRLRQLASTQATLQNLFRVDRVVGNLFASRDCLSAYSTGVLGVAIFLGPPFPLHPGPWPTPLGPLLPLKGPNRMLLPTKALTQLSCSVTALFPFLFPVSPMVVCEVRAGVCASYSSSLPVCGVNPALSIPQDFVAAAYTSCTNSNNVRAAPEEEEWEEGLCIGRHLGWLQVVSLVTHLVSVPACVDPWLLHQHLGGDRHSERRHVHLCVRRCVLGPATELVVSVPLLLHLLVVSRAAPAHRYSRAPHDPCSLLRRGVENVSSCAVPGSSVLAYASNCQRDQVRGAGSTPAESPVAVSQGPCAVVMSRPTCM